MIADKIAYLKRALAIEMESLGVEAVISMSPENFLHTAGVHVPSQRMIRERLALSVFGLNCEPFAVVSSVVARTVARDSWIEDVVAWNEHDESPVARLATELRRRGLSSGRVALEKGYLASSFYEELCRELSEVEWVDGDAMLDRTRMVKTSDEIEVMRRNGIAAEQAIWAGFLFTRVGTSEREIALRMVSALIDLGGDSSPFMSLAAGAEHSREHHAVPGGYRLRLGDTLAVDMVGMFGGYYTDYARMAIVGKAGTGQRRAWRNVVEIQRQLLDDAVPGVTAESIFRKAERYASDCGTSLDTNLVGHSLGICLHEYPVLTAGCTEELQPGMTLCIEILVQHPEYGRFHVEDLVEVRKRGAARRLTTYFDTHELYRIQL